MKRHSRPGPPTQDQGRRARNFAPTGAGGPSALLNQAVACHRMGELAQAEQLYRQILHAQPRHFDGLHLLGIVHHQRGEYREAVRRIGADRVRASARCVNHFRGISPRQRMHFGRNDENSRVFETVRAQRRRHIPAIHARHGDIEDHHVGLARFRQLQAAGPVSTGNHCESQRREYFFDEHYLRAIVVGERSFGQLGLGQRRRDRVGDVERRRNAVDRRAVARWGASPLSTL